MKGVEIWFRNGTRGLITGYHGCRVRFKSRGKGRSGNAAIVAHWWVRIGAEYAVVALKPRRQRRWRTTLELAEGKGFPE